jgi:hypothetical protein
MGEGVSLRQGLATSQLAKSGLLIQIKGEPRE